MRGLQRKVVYALLVAVLSICACATSTKRLSDDLEAESFTIRICCEGEEVSGPTITLTDAESTERLLHWFRNRPHDSGDVGTQIIQQVVAEALRKDLPAVWIETPRFRVTLPLPALVVVLEARDTPTDEWSKSTWQMRKEDMEFLQWVLAEYKRLLIERGPMENDVPEE